MTWQDYLVTLPPEERELVRGKNGKRGQHYSQHYAKWRRIKDPNYSKKWIKKKDYKRNKEDYIPRKDLTPEQLERVRAYNRNWWKQNPEKRRVFRKRARKRNGRSPADRMMRAIRRRLRRVLKGVRHTTSISKAIGLTASGLRRYLESLWQPGMSWINYGYGPEKWNIDHTVPLSSAKGNVDLLFRLQHFTNLCPMWHEENMRKRDSLEWSLTSRPNLDNIECIPSSK